MRKDIMSKCAQLAQFDEELYKVTRIMEVEADIPYDVLGVNHNMSSDNIKKKYWKMSLLVHPDKCSHPQAHQAFIKLNKAFKELQDPEKRKAMDEKIKLKEEKEQFQTELKTMREVALWRRSQGISMEGDEELLAQTEVKVEPKRDEWMASLPPERKKKIQQAGQGNMVEKNATMHVVMIPWSAFGHLVPFFQLSIALAKSGVSVSFISTPKNIRRLPKIPSTLSHLVHLVQFPLPSLDKGLLPEGAEATVDLPFENIQYLKLAYDQLQHPVKQFVANHTPDCIICDLVLTGL